jgi:hypothetical protein
MSIAETLVGKSGQERCAIKGAALVARATLGKVDGGGMKVEIVSTGATKFGLEVMVRAWDSKGNPLGFGPKGDVETERIRIHNPPIMVYAGDDKDGEPTYREDLKAALLEDVFHTISICAKPGSKPVAGSIGNTISTFYPGANGVNDPVDGYCGQTENGVTFSTLTGGVGDYAKDTDLAAKLYLTGHTTTDRFNYLYRLLMGFDTSGIGSDTISAAVLSLVPNNIYDATGDDPGLVIVTSAPASSTALANGDYDSVGSTSFASVAMASLSVGSYHDFTLNASGRANINKGGYSYFGAMLDWDFDDSFGGTWASGATWGYKIRESAYSGTTSDPKLVVTHASGGATVSLGVLECQAAIHSLTPAPGAVTTSLGALECRAELLGPTVVPGGVTAALVVLEAEAALLTPVMSPGPITVPLDALEAVAELLDVTMIGGGGTALLGVLGAEAAIHGLTPAPGGVSVELGVLGIIARLMSPTFPGTATGPLAVPAVKLRQLIAATPEFQAWVGAADATEAEASIHIGGVVSPVRPFVVIRIDAFDALRYAGGARSWFLPRGALRVLWEEGIAAENRDGHADAETAFLGGLDTILRAVLDLAGSDDHISLDAFDLIDDPARSADDEDDAYYQAPTVARWGLE